MSGSARPKRGLLFQVRVALLLTVLIAVVAYAIHDVSKRRARNDWSRPLDVAIVLVVEEGVDPKAVAAMKSRIGALEQRLHAEMKRYRTATDPPFRFELFGPVGLEAPAPSTKGGSIVDLAKHALDLRSWVKRIDERVSLPSRAYDARLYVSAHAPKSDERFFVEGESQEGGYVGTVDVELADEMADLALFVVAHETLHTLGATDRYDAAGRVQVPDGLGEPERTPRYPQMKTEIMARSRVIDTEHEVPPVSIDELVVGEKTAREIRWL